MHTHTHAHTHTHTHICSHSLCCLCYSSHHGCHGTLLYWIQVCYACKCSHKNTSTHTTAHSPYTNTLHGSPHTHTPPTPPTLTTHTTHTAHTTLTHHILHNTHHTAHHTLTTHHTHSLHALTTHTTLTGVQLTGDILAAFMSTK